AARSRGPAGRVCDPGVRAERASAAAGRDLGVVRAAGCGLSGAARPAEAEEAARLARALAAPAAAAASAAASDRAVRGPDAIEWVAYVRRRGRSPGSAVLHSSPFPCN